MMVAEEEFLEPWECERCGIDLGMHSRGIEITCPVCGLLVFPGFDNRALSEERMKEFDELKKRADRHAKQRYKAMRER